MSNCDTIVIAYMGKHVYETYEPIQESEVIYEKTTTTR